LIRVSSVARGNPRERCDKSVSSRRGGDNAIRRPRITAPVLLRDRAYVVAGRPASTTGHEALGVQALARAAFVPRPNLGYENRPFCTRRGSDKLRSCAQETGHEGATLAHDIEHVRGGLPHVARAIS
jgi:hypothetical protein